MIKINTSLMDMKIAVFLSVILHTSIFFVLYSFKVISTDSNNLIKGTSSRYINIVSLVSSNNLENNKKHNEKIQSYSNGVILHNKKNSNVIQKNKQTSIQKKQNVSRESFYYEGKSIIINNMFLNEGANSSIHYKILYKIEPSYPSFAKRVSYSKNVEVKVKFLVDKNGNVSNITILNDVPNLGFKEEVIKALKKWKFSKIIVNNKQFDAYFYKTFKFNSNNI